MIRSFGRALSVMVWLKKNDLFGSVTDMKPDGKNKGPE